MDLLDSLRALLRRWPVTVALLAVTIIATVGALMAIPWQYESKATVVFLSSRKGSQPVGGNPWLAFDASLTITAEVISRGMSDERTLQMLKDEGKTAEFTVGLAQDSRGPLLDITATGPDPKVAQATMETLATLSQQRLTEMQQKSAILPDATIRAELVTSSDKAELTPEKKIRLLVIIFAGGMLVTIGVPLFLESLAQKRRRLAQPDHGGTRVGQPPAGPSHPQRVPRSAGGGASPRPAGGAPRGRPSARSPRPFDPPEPTLYDRRITSSPSSPSSSSAPSKHTPPPEPRDPWAGQQEIEEGYTAPMPPVKPQDDLYVWTDDMERPRRGAGSGASGSPGNGSRPGAASRSSSGAESSSSAARKRPGSHSRSAPDDADDEPYVVFDPTRPGR
ncbi:YveK family protein [Sphaerisporangium rhizosphaerae]|uniref:Polysaccharide chain length determinant N-terminal domain-containing protein n=1 Tax=Sphaerisporangium rhizosphaerae TaxID=2269375 RepID=A0ABW2NVY8_9ACTN